MLKQENKTHTRVFGFLWVHAPLFGVHGSPRPAGAVVCTTAASRPAWGLGLAAWPGEPRDVQDVVSIYNEMTELSRHSRCSER